MVFNFRGRARTPCPVVIEPLSHQALLTLDEDAIDQQKAEVKTREDEIDAWMTMDLKAQSFIVKYLGASEHTHTRNCQFAYEMWDSLKSFYELQGEIEVSNATAQLSAIIMTESEDITVYVRRLQELHSLLDRLGEPVPITKQATNLLNSLNTKYSPMVKTIQTWSQTAPQLYNIPTILSTLVQEDVREEINARKRGDNVHQGFGAGHAHYGGASSDRHSGSLGGGGKANMKCHKCNSFGHLKAECTKPQTCHACGKPGHIARDCRQQNKGGGDSKPPSNFRGGGMKCNHCGKSGHTVDRCYLRMQDMGAAARLAASPTDFDASQSLTYTASSHVFSSTTNPKMPLILDSGATDHIFPSRDYFSEYSTSAIPLQSSFIYTADNQPHEVKGSGIVTLRLHRGMEETTIRLHALHVPSLGQTLVSLGCINRRGGVEFKLSKTGIPTLTKDDETWADLKTTQNGLFLLSGHIVMPGSEDEFGAEKGQALSVGRDWHLRLGHPGLTMMNVMSSQGLIPKLNSSESTEIANCEICCQSKMAQSPHQHVNEDNQRCGKMDKIHLDLVGPLAVISAHGAYSYFQAGIDVGTRLSFVNLLQRKSDALAISKVAIAALECEAKTNLKSLRTDGGGEYVSAAWKQFVQDKGIRHELTAPYSPQQNGMAERLNRTLLEKMRCLLIWSGLPKSYWDVALLHANWLRNRLPTSALKGGIPIVEWSKKTTNLKKIHTFGCLVQYLLIGHDKGKRSEKFASRTSFGIFLGMPSNQAGYLVFDPKRTGVLVRDDVKFFDDVPGYPRLMAKASREVRQPLDADYFTLFPDEEEESSPILAPPTPTSTPAVAAVPPPTQLPIVTPIDVVQLSSDTESGADGDNEEEGEVDWVTTEGESIADRVSARRRANLATFGDVL